MEGFLEGFDGDKPGCDPPAAVPRSFPRFLADNLEALLALLDDKGFSSYKLFLSFEALGFLEEFFLALFF
jgi:hypothetical protein